VLNNILELKTRFTTLLFSTLLVTFMSMSLMSSSEIIEYIVIHPTSERSFVAVDPCNTTYIVVLNHKISIVYTGDPSQLVLNINGQPVNYTLVKIEDKELNIEVNTDDQGQRLSRFNVKHVYIDTSHLVVETYYDVESKILLYSYVFNKLSNEECEVLIKRIPSIHTLACISEINVNRVDEATRDTGVQTNILSEESRYNYTIFLTIILLASISIIVFTLWRKRFLKHVSQNT